MQPPDITHHHSTTLKNGTSCHTHLRATKAKETYCPIEHRMEELIYILPIRQYKQILHNLSLLFAYTRPQVAESRFSYQIYESPVATEEERSTRNLLIGNLDFPISYAYSAIQPFIPFSDRRVTHKTYSAKRTNFVIILHRLVYEPQV